MRRIDKALKVLPIAEALIDAEIPDRQEAPIDLHADIGHRHDLHAVDAEISQVRETVDRAINAAAELVQHQLVNHQFAKARSASYPPVHSTDNPDTPT